jgi:hypothetical protein
MVARKAMMFGELEYIYSILPSYETCILNRNYPSILHLLANINRNSSRNENETMFGIGYENCPEFGVLGGVIFKLNIL